MCCRYLQDTEFKFNSIPNFCIVGIEKMVGRTRNIADIFLDCRANASNNTRKAIAPLYTRILYHSITYSALSSLQETSVTACEWMVVISPSFSSGVANSRTYFGGRLGIFYSLRMVSLINSFKIYLKEKKKQKLLGINFRNLFLKNDRPQKNSIRPRIYSRRIFIRLYYNFD